MNIIIIICIKILFILLKGFFHSTQLISFLYEMNIKYILLPEEFPYMDWIYDDRLIEDYKYFYEDEFEDTMKIIKVTRIILLGIKLFSYFYY